MAGLLTDSILLLGEHGQLGRSLVAQCKAADIKLRQWTHDEYPSGRRIPLNEVFALCTPQVIINATAYTQVELAEEEPEQVMAVNRDKVCHLARVAKQHDALLVHFSTDYVFDGSGVRPWCEEDTPNPLNIYGQSKWFGEQEVIASGCRYRIIRTSWLHSPWRHNFVKTMLRLGQTQSELSVVCDQIGAPTSAALLAELTMMAVTRVQSMPSLAGLYHVTAEGEVSWFHYADFIFNEAHRIGLIEKVPRLIPVTSASYRSPVRRPLNSRLDTMRFCSTFGVKLPDWREGVRDTLLQLQRTK